MRLEVQISHEMGWGEGQEAFLKIRRTPDSGTTGVRRVRVFARIRFPRTQYVCCGIRAQTLRCRCGGRYREITGDCRSPHVAVVVPGYRVLTARRRDVVLGHRLQ